jgi:DNA helicase-2/ATP-dependent DNA helicase PcrA
MIRKYFGMKANLTLSELARALVDETGILAVLKDENTPESLGRRENIQELVSALSEFTELHPDARLEDFLEEVALVSDVDLADLERNAVTLMTLHSAKGLEYPVVFITGLEEGIFPLAAALEERQGLEEERRLMYVGMTRARERLYLSHATSRYRFGQLSYMVRSRFLDEIDPELLQADSAAASSPEVQRERAQIRQRVRRRERATERESPFPSYEDESQETVHPRVGVRVFHESFGRGRIVAMEGNGEKARAIVDFETAGKKHLLLKYAQLKIETA